VIFRKAIISGPHAIRQSAIPPHPSILFSCSDPSGVGQTSAGPARILIVEDDFLVASDMEMALTEAGMEIAGVASSAEKALELAEAERPALAVMDIRLAGKRDGIDAALDLFGTLGIRCVFATAHHDTATRARAEAAHPLAWVSKPYTMATLIEAVRDALKEAQGKQG
jgi:DNA-binding NarL/FixJ family response regulator